MTKHVSDAHLPESAVASRHRDPRRLRALHRLHLLDTPPEEAFDRLTRLASRILKVPVTLVSLVDEERQFFKSSVGLPEPWAKCRQTPLTHSFCQHVVATQQPFIVEDARLHPMVRDNLAVPELGVIAYAGVPLTTLDGYTLGAFCAIDGQPRKWEQDDLDTLNEIAGSAMTEIELRHVNQELAAVLEATEFERNQKELLLHSMFQGMYGLDEQGRCTFINSAGAKLLGYRIDELVGRDMHVVIHHTTSNGSAYPPDSCPILRALREDQVYRGEDEVYWRKDGSHFSVEYAVSPLAAGTGVRGVVVTFSDITERKEMQRRVAVQHAVSGVLAHAVDFNEAAPLLLEAIGGALKWQVGSVWRVDEEAGVLRSVVTWSDPEFPASRFEAATRDFTFAPGEGMPGCVWESRKPWWSADISQEPEFYRAVPAAQDGLHSAIWFPILLAGEVKGVMEFFSDRVYLPDDELLRTVLTVGRHIGEFITRTGAQRALKQSEARKAAIFAAALDGIVTIDHHGRVLDWNPAAEQIFGYRRTEVLDKDMADLIIPEPFRSAHREGIEKYLHTGTGPVLDRRVEISALHANGTEFPVELAITAVENGAEPLFFGFVRDITERRESERKLYESERFARNVVDALSSEIAILDETGMIISVNRLWQEFALKHGVGSEPIAGVGVNYLEVCDLAAGHGSKDAAEVAVGIRAVIQGSRALLEHEYACHSPNERRWFIARITRFTGDGLVRVVVAHENITQRKLAELEREHYASYNQLLLDSTGEGIFGVDVQGRCTFINRAASRILGFQMDEALGKSMHELTHHHREDGTPYPASECPIYDSFRTGIESEVRGEVFWRRDGGCFPVEYSSNPLLENGIVRGAVVVFSDESQRLIAERELRLLSLVASKTDNAVIITNRERRIEWVNDGFTRITGYRPEEVLGKKPGDLLQGPLTDPETVVRIRNRLRDKASFSEEILNYRKNGEPYWLALSISPVLDEHGEVDRYIAIESDISERKKEDARREEQIRLASLMAEVGTAITESDQLGEMLQRCAAALVQNLGGAFARIWTLEPGQGLLRLRASAGLYTHIDGAHSEIPVGQFKIGLIAQERKPHLTNAVQQDPRVSDQDWARREGMIAFAGYPLIVAGNVVGVMGMFARHALSPATLDAMAPVANGIALGIQRMHYQEALQTSKDAVEQANQAKSQFLANMSHELRTPLNAVIMYCELLMEQVEDYGFSQFLPDLEKIRNAGKHLLALISNVLDLSKIESGKMDVFFEEFDVRSMVEDVVATIQPLVAQKFNRLELDCSHDLGKFCSDLTKVRQILFNLLSNASKFTDQGSIGLTVRSARRHDQAYVAFEVRDSGIGMTDEQRQKLFQPFTQADSSTTRKYGGTGLGLAISRRLCEMLGGEIEVQSQLHSGSTFTAYLPRRMRREIGLPVPAANLESDDATTPALGTVLVIDDDPQTLEVLCRLLRSEGYRAVTADGGEQGLQLARTVRPDVILLDVMMPRIDGWAVLSSLKTDPQLNEIPVIMISMLDESHFSYLLGASEYLVKPIQRSQLFTILDKYRPVRPQCQMLVVGDDAEMRRSLHDLGAAQGWDVVEAENGRQAFTRILESRPDMILLDLLMPNMDGFEFAAELQRNESWGTIPIVALTATQLGPGERQRLTGNIHQVVQQGTNTRDVMQQLLRMQMQAVTARSSTKTRATNS